MDSDLLVLDVLTRPIVWPVLSLRSLLVSGRTLDRAYEKTPPFAHHSGHGARVGLRTAAAVSTEAKRARLIGSS